MWDGLHQARARLRWKRIFINLKANKHLDTTWGGYCSFATVLDAKSMQVVDKIAAEIKGAKSRVKIQQVRLVERGS